MLINKSKEGDLPPITDTFLTGSYVRYTKIAPLDDVDMFIVLKSSLLAPPLLPIYTTTRPSTQSQLRNMVDKNGNVSSKLVLDSFVKVIKYLYPDSTKVIKDGQAVNCWLKTYNLGLDVVPSFHFDTLFSGNYYLIPSGGNSTGWIKTNPTTDKALVQKINSNLNGKFRGTVKLIKYWNKKFNKTPLRSYHLEAIAITILETICFYLL